MIDETDIDNQGVASPDIDGREAVIPFSFKDSGPALASEILRTGSPHRMTPATERWITVAAVIALILLSDVLMFRFWH